MCGTVKFAKREFERLPKCTESWDVYRVEILVRFQSSIMRYTRFLFIVLHMLECVSY